MSSDNPISIPLGITIGLLASCVQSLGLTIQRKSHVLNQSLPERLQRLEHRRPLWLLGFAVFISSNILGSFVQIASLPVVILAPLGAVSLLWNAFFARFLLGDVFSPWMVLGTIFIIGGAVLIAIFGIVPEQTRSLEDLLELFRRPTFIAYFSVLGFVVTVSLVITHITEFSLGRTVSNTRPSNSSSIDLSATNTSLHTHTTNITASLTDEINDTMLANEQTPLLDPKSGIETPSPGISDSTIASIRRTRLMLAISYAAFSGIISGMCLLFAKSGVELLLLTLRGKNQFWRWEAWCLLLGLVVFALLQLWYLHKGLVLAGPTIVCPSAFCLYNLSSIVNGLVYFDQFPLMPPLHLLLVSIGMTVLLGGVWVVSIQSDGGGVDLGTWDEEIVDLGTEALETILEADGVSSTTERMALLHQPGNICQERIKPTLIERETRSESGISNGPGTDGLEFGETRISQLPDERGLPRRSKTLYSSSRIPSVYTAGQSIDQQHSRISSSPSSSQLLNRIVSHTHVPMHQASFHLPHSHANALAHGTLSSALGPVLQIGLSPVSPGFAILPLERKRTRLRNVAGGDGVASGNPGPGRRGYWRMQRRRTVSDGEVSRMARGLMGRQAESIDHISHGPVDESQIETDFSVGNLRQEDQEVQEVGSIVQQAENRWRWFGDFLPKWPRN